VPLLILLGAVALGLVGLVVLVRRRSLSGFENGFLLTLGLVLAGTGALSAALVGVWLYLNAATGLVEGAVTDLAHNAQLIEATALRDINMTIDQMTRVAAGIGPDVQRRVLKEIDVALRTFHRVDPMFIELDVVDAAGRLVVTTNRRGRRAPLNRIAVAFALEGKRFVSDPTPFPELNKSLFVIAVPVPDAQGRPIAALVGLYDQLNWFQDIASAMTFGQTGYAVLVNYDGRVLAHPDVTRSGADLSGYTAVKEARQGRSGWIVERNMAGVRRLFVYRPVKNPATVSPRPWLVVAEMDETEALAPVRSFRLQGIAIAAVVVAVCLGVAYQVSLYLKRPLNDLLQFAQRVRAGDLTARAHPDGRDELARLETALNEMVLGLQERDRVKEVFGRYVTTQVSEEILKGSISLGGQRRRVTMLFSDIRNFTSMAEIMPAEQVVEFLNDYFSEMVDAVFEHGGVLDKFMGDGMMCVFGSVDEAPDHPRRAVMAGLRMKALLAKINGERTMAGKPPIAIGIGIHTDDVIVGNIGSRRRLEYTVIGDGVNTCQRVEAANKEFGTTILITESTYEAVRDEFECRPMPEAALKGKTKTPRLFEVLSAHGPADMGGPERAPQAPLAARGGPAEPRRPSTYS
jgi:class 3 adenylate cyclase